MWFPFRRKAKIDYSKIICPYIEYDHGVNPRWFLWQLYHEPISQLVDERVYSNSALRFLRANAELIDESVEIEDDTKAEDGDDLLPFGYDERGAKFMYRDNLVAASQSADETVKLTLYRPLSKPFVTDDFAKWVIETKGESKVSILVRKNGGLVANKVAFKPPVIEDLELNYGTGFNKTYEKLKGILDSDRSSLILMHGAPGSGKSTLLKHLSSVVDREWIFIPTGIADQLASPDFISLLMDKKGAVLILEDAEGAVQARGSERVNETAVSSLLNISDGILGSILSISILVTYNCEKQFIDPALLRKGRLSLDLTLGPLNIEDSKRLAKHLGKEVEVTKPMTIAEIYGSDVDTGYVPSEPKQVGFHTLITTPERAGERKKVGE